jgi:hypothetical protein
MRDTNLPVSPHSGSWAVWLGGDFNDISYIQQQVSVTQTCPYLVFYHWIASQDICGFDDAWVRINGTTVASLQLCETSNTGAWIKRSINLSSYAGQTVTLQFRVVTDSSLNSNWFIDDVSFQSSASSAPVSEPSSLKSVDSSQFLSRIKK